MGGGGNVNFFRKAIEFSLRRLGCGSPTSQLKLLNTRDNGIVSALI